MVYYSENDAKIKTNITSIKLPSKQEVDYTIANFVWKNNPTPQCGDKATAEDKRFCYVLNYLKSNKYGYIYYKGHRWDTNQVMKNKGGNCCDLSRFVIRLATQANLSENCGSALAETRYILTPIIYNNVTYQHLFTQLRVNNLWRDLDAVNYLTSGSPTPFGKMTGQGLIIAGDYQAPCNLG